MAASMTVPTVRARKGGVPLVMVTAYDAPTARMVDNGGADMILVGDSVAMVVLGYDDTLQLTIDDMAHHVAAVARTRPNALIVGDLPWMSYHVSVAGHGAQRGHAHPGGRAGREARRRAQARADDRSARRRRDPRDGTHRADAAVAARDGWLQGAGSHRRGRACAGRRGQGARDRGVLRDRARGCARRGRLAGDASRCRCRRSASVRAAGATARCSSCTTCSASRIASRRSSSAGTPRSKPTARGGRGVRRAMCGRALPDG